MQSFRLALLLVGTGLAGLRADPVLAVWPHATAATTTDTVEIEVALLNTGETSMPQLRTSVFFDPSTPLPAELKDGDQSWPVELTPLAPAPAPPAPGQHATRAYRLHLPAAATSSPRLLIVAAANRPACELPTSDTPAFGISPESESAPTPADRLRSSGRSKRSVADLFDRGFMDRFNAHEPVYFIYGPDDPAAKFQLSFKYRLSTLHQSVVPERLPTTLQFGFTQRSLWDIDATSSPFYDTSYMPALFIERLASLDDESRRDSPWLGLQAGYRHESNGRDGDISRSLNQLYVRTAFILGDPDSYNLVAIPEVWTYVGDLGNNPDIEAYRGHARLSLIFSRGDGPSLNAQLWSGDSFEHFSTQVDLNVPVRLGIVDVGTYLLVQYYNGYGESLLSYREKSDTIRAGLAFVR